MPFYQFICEKCGYTEDFRREMLKRNDPCPCPKCKTEMTRQMGNVSFDFSKGGDGFYANNPKKQESDFLKESKKIFLKEGQKVKKIKPPKRP